MSANNLYRGLFELLTLPQGGDGPGASLATTQGGRRELLSVARMEGCLPELYARWAAAGLLSPSESVEHEQLARRRAAAAEVLQALPRGSLVADADGSQRGSGTLEVLIADFAAIGPLHEAVARLGYRLQGAGEWLVPLRGPMHQRLRDVPLCAPVHRGGRVSRSRCRSAASRSMRAATSRSPNWPGTARGSPAASVARWSRRASCCTASRASAPGRRLSRCARSPTSTCC